MHESTEEGGGEGHKATENTATETALADRDNREHSLPLERLALDTDSVDVDPPKDFREDFEGSIERSSSVCVGEDFVECERQRPSKAAKKRRYPRHSIPQQRCVLH